MISVAISKSNFVSNRTRFRKLFAEIVLKIKSQTKQQTKIIVVVVVFLRRRTDIEIFDFDKLNSEIDMKYNFEMIKKTE